jgi:hypothetical protein
MTFARIACWLTVSLAAWNAAGLLSAGEVDVYLLSGQSNMQGNAKLADLPEALQAPIPGCQFWDGKQFVELIPGKTKTSARPGEFGPEITFARTMCELRPGKTIYIVKFYRSGQPLYHGWNGNEWAGGDPAPDRKNFYPGTETDDPNIGTHYRDMMATTQPAFAALREAGHEPRLRGIVWMQGEQDAKHELSAGLYDKALGELKRRIEEDLNSKPVPFVFGQVLPHEPPLERFVWRDLIRSQQARADMRSGTPEAILGCWMVSTDGMPLQDDTVHFSATGYAMMGQAFALGMMQAEGYLEMLRAKAAADHP